MKSQERRILRRKKGGHFSHGQEVRVWENHRRERKMVIIKMVSVHVLHCCIVVSAVDVILILSSLSKSVGVTEGKDAVQSEGQRVATITVKFIKKQV